MRTRFILIIATIVSVLFSNQTIINNNNLTDLDIVIKNDVTLNVNIELGDILITEENLKHSSNESFINVSTITKTDYKYQIHEYKKHFSFQMQNHDLYFHL